MKIDGKLIKNVNTRISESQDVLDSMQEFFENNPQIKKSHWIGRAVAEKLEREKKKVGQGK